MRRDPLPKKRKVPEPSMPQVPTTRLEDSRPGEIQWSTQSQRTVATLEQQIKKYEKLMEDLDYEMTILQRKVRELESNDESHLACRVEAQSLRKDKEAAEELAAAYKEQLMRANQLISKLHSKL